MMKKQYVNPVSDMVLSKADVIRTSDIPVTLKFGNTGDGDKGVVLTDANGYTTLFD